MLSCALPGIHGGRVDGVPSRSSKHPAEERAAIATNAAVRSRRAETVCANMDDGAAGKAAEKFQGPASGAYSEEREIERPDMVAATACDWPAHPSCDVNAES